MSTTLRYARFASDSTKEDTIIKKEVKLRTEEQEKMMAEREAYYKKIEERKKSGREEKEGGSGYGGVAVGLNQKKPKSSEMYILRLSFNL